MDLQRIGHELATKQQQQCIPEPKQSVSHAHKRIVEIYFPHELVFSTSYFLLCKNIFLCLILQHRSILLEYTTCTICLYDKHSSSETCAIIPFLCVHAQSCPSLCDSIHGVFLARILEWVATSYSSRSSQPRDKPESLASRASASRFFATGK